MPAAGGSGRCISAQISLLIRFRHTLQVKLTDSNELPQPNTLRIVGLINVPVAGGNCLLKFYSTAEIQELL